MEYPETIKEFNVSTGVVTRSFDLSGTMGGSSSSGLEALTFVPDESSSEGGYFYAGHQGEGAIYVFELPIESSSSSTTVSFIDSFKPDTSKTRDISGLHYEASNELLYVVYDQYNAILELEIDDSYPDNSYVDSWTLYGDNQEGIAVGPNCELFISEDDGNVRLYEVQ